MARLEDLYEPAFARLASGEFVEFKQADFEPPPHAIVTDGISLRRSARVIDGYRHEQIWLLAKKPAFRRLALVLVAGLFNAPHGGLPIRIELTDSESALTALFIEPCELGFHASGFRGRFELDEFDWHYKELHKHPWIDGHLPTDPNDLPRLNFSDQPDGYTLGFKPATGLNIQGNVRGRARLIELLLTISDPRNEGVEFVLEGEDGFRGVAPASIEVVFWLPGSIIWQE